MFNRHIFFRLSILLLIICLAFITISGRSCGKRSNDRRVSSSSGFRLNTPSGLYASSFSPYQINLNWDYDYSTAVDAFEIQRRIGIDGLWQQIAIVGPTSLSYPDNGAVPSVTYYYRVRAFTAIDTSDWSNIASATTSEAVWSAIACGEQFSLVLTSDGILWSWGRNDFFQLGLGDVDRRLVPTPVSSETDWQTIATKPYHSLGIKTDGTLYSWGANAYGQLGMGDSEFNNPVPFPVITETDWSMMAAGGTVIFGYTLGIKNNRTLWAWGYNDNGQLGLGYTTPSTACVTALTTIGNDSDWVFIKAGLRHSIGIRTNRTIWGWGGNGSAQLGLGYTTPTGITTPTRIGNDSDWLSVAVGNMHNIAMKTTGSIWSWGDNFNGQLGLGDSGNGTYRITPTRIGNTTDWSLIEAGGSSSFAIKTNKTIWSWGGNAGGQLGLGDSGASNRMTPTQIGTNSDWSKVASGSYHTLAIKANNTMWAWGDNWAGQLGLGDTADRNTPTQINLGLPSCPSRLMATVISSLRFDLSWADNSYNEDGFKIERKITLNGNWEQIGTVTTNVASYPDISSIGFNPTTPYYYRVRSYNNSFGDSIYSNEAGIAISGNWSDISVGGLHAIGKKTNGAIWIWGGNKNYALGLGDTNQNAYRNTPTRLGTESDWAVIEPGTGHTIARKTDNTIWTWGLNNSGQLGLGDTTTNRATPTRVVTSKDWSAVAAGIGHTLACKTNGTLWAWGDNGYGQLGDGTVIDRTTPRQINSSTGWSMLAAGASHTMALKNNGTLWAWGYNFSGQLGLGDSGPGSDRADPIQVGAGVDWSILAAGNSHTVACKTTGTLWSWGLNTYGQLGLGDTITRTAPSQVGTDSNWSKVSAGEYHNIALKNNNTIWLWGRNSNGQLGLVDFNERLTPAQSGIASDWSIVRTGGNSSFAIKTNRTLWSWGLNNDGRLGLGDNNDRNMPSLIGED